MSSLSELSNSALHRQFIWQLVTGEQSEDLLLITFAKALGQTPEHFSCILKDAAAIEAHRERTAAFCAEAMDPATDWASVPNPRRVELILAVKQSHPPPDPWAPSEVFCLFSERVRSLIGPSLFGRLLKSATKLDYLHPLGYQSHLWDIYVNEVDEEERFHNTYRYMALAHQDSLVAGTNSEAFWWCYKSAHCEECIAIGLAKMPEERRVAILKELQDERDADYADYLDQQEEMMNSYHSGW
jgi:hypothetical protein